MVIANWPSSVVFLLNEEKTGILPVYTGFFFVQEILVLLSPKTTSTGIHLISSHWPLRGRWQVQGSKATRMGTTATMATARRGRWRRRRQRAMAMVATMARTWRRRYDWHDGEEDESDDMAVTIVRTKAVARSLIMINTCICLVKKKYWYITGEYRYILHEINTSTRKIKMRNTGICHEPVFLPT